MPVDRFVDELAEEVGFLLRRLAPLGCEGADAGIPEAVEVGEVLGVEGGRALLDWGAAGERGGEGWDAGEGGGWGWHGMRTSVGRGKGVR